MPIIRSWALTTGYALHPGTRNRYKTRYTTNQHRPASRQVNDHGRVSGTHRALMCCSGGVGADRGAEVPDGLILSGVGPVIDGLEGQLDGLDNHVDG